MEIKKSNIGNAMQTVCLADQNTYLLLCFGRGMADVVNLLFMSSGNNGNEGKLCLWLIKTQRQCSCKKSLCVCVILCPAQIYLWLIKTQRQCSCKKSLCVLVMLCPDQIYLWLSKTQNTAQRKHLASCLLQPTTALYSVCVFYYSLSWKIVREGFSLLLL